MIGVVPSSSYEIWAIPARRFAEMARPHYSCRDRERENPGVIDWRAIRQSPTESEPINYRCLLAGLGRTQSPAEHCSPAALGGLGLKRSSIVSLTAWGLICLQLSALLTFSGDASKRSWNTKWVFFCFLCSSRKKTSIYHVAGSNESAYLLIAISDLR